MIAATRYPAFSRNFEDEQDYADAAVSAARKANSLPSGVKLAPILRWKRRQQRQQEGEASSHKVKCKTLIVGFEGGGASFAQRCFGLTAEEADWIGTVVLPGAPCSGADAASTTGGIGDSLDPTDPLNSACNIFRKTWAGKDSRGSNCDNGEGCGEAEPLSNGSNANGNPTGGDGGGGKEKTGDESSAEVEGGSGGGGVASKDNDEGSGGDVLVVLCGYRVPPRQADSWAKALLGGIEAEVVVALTTVEAEPGRSEGWRGARLLATAEAEEREDCLKMSVGFQPLRTPTMLSGAPAALVSYCQRHGQAAMCFAAAEPPGRRATAMPQQQLGADGGGGGGGGRLALAEKNLSFAREALGIVAGAAVVVSG
ncbi:unnamed protein product, partial [Ectocarpus sp. 12 AP-2014]